MGRPATARIERRSACSWSALIRVAPNVAAVVQPVAKRLSRMEALLIEMRYEQDVQLKLVDDGQSSLLASQTLWAQTGGVYCSVWNTNLSHLFV